MSFYEHNSSKQTITLHGTAKIQDKHRRQHPAPTRRSAPNALPGCIAQVPISIDPTPFTPDRQYSFTYPDAQDRPEDFLHPHPRGHRGVRYHSGRDEIPPCRQAEGGVRSLAPEGKHQSLRLRLIDKALITDTVQCYRVQYYTIE